MTPSTMHYEAPPITLSEVQAEEVTYPVETLQDQARTIASEYGVSFETMEAIIDTETGGTWKPDLISKTGDYGLVQINLRWHPEITQEQALDPTFALNWLASEIKKGNEWKFTGCSCIQTLKALGVKIKGNAADITMNTETPEVGDVILFEYKKNPYPNNRHAALITAITDKGYSIREGNFQKCRITTRFVEFNHPSIKGFYKPASSG